MREADGDIESFSEDQKEGFQDINLNGPFPDVQKAAVQGQINKTLTQKDLGTVCHYDAHTHEPSNLGY